MIALIDYKAGNLASVSNALARYDVDYTITNHTEELDAADGIIFPGVGHANAAMESLRDLKLVNWLQNTNKTILGICVGMQLFFEYTPEGEAETLGIIPGKLQKFDARKAKVPHMGWNNFTELDHQNPLLKGLTEDSYFYFVHSYYAPVTKYSVASCSYGATFSAMVQRDNYYGVQFHPEKSGPEGALLLQNFLDIVYE